MLRSLLFILAISSALSLSAQLEFEGLWEGTIMIGGLESTKGLPIKMYFIKEGKNISGRSYIYVNDLIWEAEIEGYIYSDLSVDIKEFNFIENADNTSLPPYLRKFQLSWKRGLNGSFLNGYWQEVATDIFNPKRARGRVYMQKVTNQRA